MVAKNINPDATAARKALTMYRLLIFSGRRYSPTAWSELLGCSKPTVPRTIQRLVQAHRTDRNCTPPKHPPADACTVFGLMPGEQFTAVVEAEARVVPYLKERTWSSDQKFEDLDDGRVRLAFSATSEEEVVRWGLGFAGQVVLLEPTGVRERIRGCSISLGNAHSAQALDLLVQDVESCRNPV